jgi:hypothetical protein
MFRVPKRIKAKKILRPARNDRHIFKVRLWWPKTLPLEEDGEIKERRWLQDAYVLCEYYWNYEIDGWHWLCWATREEYEEQMRNAEWVEV